MFVEIILYIAFTIFIIYLVSPFLGKIIFGEPKEFNKLVSKYQQSNQIMQHIKKDHHFPNLKCINSECLASWKALEEEIAVLEKKQSKLMKFIIRPKKRKK